jgi:hypothetical protein
MDDEAVRATPAASPSTDRNPGFRFFGYVTEREFAKLIGRPARTVAEDRQAKRLTIPYAKFGKQILYRIEAVKAYLLSLEQVPRSALAVDESVEFYKSSYCLNEQLRFATKV